MTRFRSKKTMALLAILALSCGPLWAQDSRHFPAPSTVSVPMAQAINRALEHQRQETIPDLSAAKRERGPESDAHVLALAQAYQVRIDQEVTGGVTVRTLTPPVLGAGKEDKIIYAIHGGGYVFGGGMASIGEGLLMAHFNGYRVIVPDYRTAPEDPFPAAIDDAFAVYRELVNRHGAQNIAVMGTSTGGAMALILALQALEAGVPLPAALISGTPWSDLDKIGDSYVTNEGVDSMLVSYDGWIRTAAGAYAQSEDLKNPLISPVYGSDSDLAQFPPTLLVTGTRDLFLSNTARMHTRLRLNGVEAELLVYEGQSHAQYCTVLDAPETRDHHRLMDQFLDRWLLKRQP